MSEAKLFTTTHIIHKITVLSNINSNDLPLINNYNPYEIYILFSILECLPKSRSLLFYHIALRKAKIVHNFGLSECNMVKNIHQLDTILHSKLDEGKWNFITS